MSAHIKASKSSKGELHSRRSTALQDLVRKENYAIYTLKSMLSSLIHVEKVLGSSYTIRLLLLSHIQDIKEIQQARKGAKQNETHTKEGSSK